MHYYHNDNTPMQYTVIFHVCRNDYFQMKNFDIFLVFAQNIDFGYTLEHASKNLWVGLTFLISFEK